MTTFNGFLAVKTGSDCSVCIDGETYDLGGVKSIYATHREYIVWFSDDGQLWYEIDHSKVTLSKEFHEFWQQYQTQKSESRHNFSQERIATLEQMFASSLASALENQFEAANATLKSISEFIRLVNDRAAKGRYLVGVVSSAIISLFISITLYGFYYYLPVDQVFQLCAHVFGGAAIGVTLSSTTGRIDDERFDPNATKLEGYLNGALRVLYGLCGALVAVLAFQSKLIDSKLITTEVDRYVFFLIAIFGGFSERFAANILSRLPAIENQAEDKQLGQKSAQGR